MPVLSQGKQRVDWRFEAFAAAADGAAADLQCLAIDTGEPRLQVNEDQQQLVGR
ncbi:hypothetical protein OOZ63_18360 [Paucibacter sp. PLA-PC-4]|uniref:hypothetical protein n=1 Tax=Paucibacter sp. PLA-PC-4 TaxID=2993655 RepID=UPI00224B0C18|nr:hypothetical protein [Paucibacter sp. PLA-PC-4]MCX2863795.1 hypothetical protein [Paucibacter sp. PLA-PC-4]